MSYNESLSAHSNYPPMSQWEWDHAPWNQEEPEPQEVEVTVSVTISKTMKIEVDDYSRDGEDIDFSDCDLREAAKDQLPDLKGWEIDDYEVVLE